MIIRAMVIGSAMLLMGCSSSEESGSNNTEAAAPSKLSEGTTKPTEGTALPGGLPKYPRVSTVEAQVEASVPGAQNGSFYGFTTPDKPDQVLDYYASAADQAGFTTLARTASGPTSALSLMKGNLAVQIAILSTPGGTQVRIAGATR